MFTENFRLDTPKESSPTRNSAIKSLKFDQFWPRYTDVLVFIGAMHSGSGLWGTTPVFGSVLSQVFFSKDVMDKPTYTSVEMSASHLPFYRKLIELAVEVSWCGQQYPTTTEQTYDI